MVANQVNPDGVKRRLQELIGGGQVHSLVNVLPQVLETVIEHDLWKTFVKADGTPFKSLGDFLVTNFPHGAGCEANRNSLTYSQLMELCQDFPTVRDVLARNAPKGKRGGDRKSERAKDDQADVRPLDRHAGNVKPVLEAKLAEHHPAVWATFLQGGFRSIRAAAEAAGLVKPANETLARLKSNWRKASAGERSAFLKWMKEEGA